MTTKCTVEHDLNGIHSNNIDDGGGGGDEDEEDDDEDDDDDDYDDDDDLMVTVAVTMTLTHTSDEARNDERQNEHLQYPHENISRERDEHDDLKRRMEGSDGEPYYGSQQNPHQRQNQQQILSHPYPELLL